MRSRRLATPADARSAGCAALTARLADFEPVRSARRIAGYEATRGEPALNELAALCHARGQQWLLPVIAGPVAGLRFAPWRPGCRMAPNRHAIPEPIVPEAELVDPPDLDVALVPLLAFDRRGQRLGSGGGHYDRAFAFLAGRDRPTRPLLVGIAWSFQEAQLAPEPWDVSLDWVATERELIRCHA
jgi:5-formyltetrahydrofolate cyclo-ligase